MTATPDGTAALLALVETMRAEMHAKLTEVQAQLVYQRDLVERMVKGTRPPASNHPAPHVERTDGPVFPNYGRSKGQPVHGASMQDLEYYANGARRSLADPNKARWHDKEKALLAAIDAEIARQRGDAPPDDGERGFENTPFAGRGGASFGGGFDDRPPPDDDNEVPF